MEKFLLLKDPNHFYILCLDHKMHSWKLTHCVQDGFAGEINLSVLLTYFRKIIKSDIIAFLTNMICTEIGKRRPKWSIHSTKQLHSRAEKQIQALWAESCVAQAKVQQVHKYFNVIILLERKLLYWCKFSLYS